jgi:hypothetical protein
VETSSLDVKEYSSMPSKREEGISIMFGSLSREEDGR